MDNAGAWPTAGCQGGLAEDLGGRLAQLCSHVMCGPGQTPAPLSLLHIPGLRSDDGLTSWGRCADEAKVGTEMLHKCRLFHSFVYSLIHSFIHSLQGGGDTSVIIIFRSNPQVVSPCSSKGPWPPVVHSFPLWGRRLPGQEPPDPSTLCRGRGSHGAQSDPQSRACRE